MQLLGSYFIDRAVFYKKKSITKAKDTHNPVHAYRYTHTYMHAHIPYTYLLKLRQSRWPVLLVQYVATWYKDGSGLGGGIVDSAESMHGLACFHMQKFSAHVFKRK
jgi:hypothetical protein